MTRSATLLCAVALAMAACRADPGAPDYPEYERVGVGGEDFLPGPNPYVKGDDRLAIGAFYEGESSELIDIDDTTTHYYIYENTYDQFVSDDRVEGAVSDELVISSAQLWWGGGVVWDSARDLSDWTTLRVSFKASDASFEAMDILIQGGADGRVKPVDHGFAADGEWHSLAIPLSAFSGVDFSQVTIPVSFLNESGPTGETLLVDDLYFTKE